MTTVLFGGAMNSIRVKLMLASGSLLVLLGLFLITYNRMAFIKDKNVYLFNAISDKRRWDQEKVDNFIKEAQQKIELLAYDYSTQGFISGSIKKMAEARQWGHFEVYKPDESQVWLLSDTIAPQASNQLNSQYWRQHERGFKFLILDSNKIQITYRTDSFSIAGMFSFKLVDQWLQESNKYIFFKNKGQAINSNKTPAEVNDIYQQFGLSINGVQEIIWNSKSYLISVLPLDSLGLVVIELVAKDEAMLSVKRVVNRTAILGLLILVIGLIALGIITTQLTVNINKLATSMLHFSDQGNAPDVKIDSSDEIGKMAMIYNQMLLKIKDLLAIAVEQTRMQGELNTAKEVQTTLLPKSTWNSEYYSLKGYYRPASECGGDIWFVHQYNEGAIIFVGDATGHGVSAALITAAVRSVLSVCVEQQQWDPSEILKLINKVLCDMAKGAKMMTGFAVNYNQVTKKLIYANASHDIPVLVPPPREGIKFNKQRLVFLSEAKSRRLGDKIDTLYQNSFLSLEDNSTLLIYTDGVVDAQNKKQESWGERQLIKLLVDLGARGIAKNIFERLIQTLEEFTSSQEQPDDITFVTLNVKNPAD